MLRGTAELPSSRATDDWPHTTRVLPWMVAGFLAMLWLVPFDSVQLPVALPVDPKLDRLVLLGMGAVWLAVALTAPPRTFRLRGSPVVAAISAFVIVALAGVALNGRTLVVLGETDVAIKKLFLLAAYVWFFVIVATVVRPAEARRFGVLVIALASITALGVLWEYRSGANVFFGAAERLLPLDVSPPPPDPEFARPSITGPTTHGLAVATVLGIALAFALSERLGATTTWGRVAAGLAVAVLFAGCLATLRRTAVVVPVAVVLVLLLYRPRAMIRLVPLGVGVIIAIQALAPGALASVRGQFLGQSAGQSATSARTSDYEAVWPDVLAHPALGRGYGTYDPDVYRFLDNQYLLALIETGFIGLGLLVFCVVAVMWTATREARSGDATRGPPSLAAAGGAAGFGAACAVFDVMAFPQAPYMFFFVAGVAVACSVREPARAPARAARSGAALRAVGLAAAGSGLLRPRALDPPDLSVVVVTHNGRERALATLESARAAAADLAVEWLVVDCGSQDGTPDAVAERFPDVSVARLRNVGFAAGNNVALARARGRFVLLLNPDVTIREGTFADLVRELEQRPTVGAASVVHESPDGGVLLSMRRDPSPARQLGESFALRRLPGLRRLQEAHDDPSEYEREQPANWLVGAFLVVRREAFDAVGPLDERFFMYSEETDLCLRIRRAGWDVRHLPVMRVVHHRSRRPAPELMAQLVESKLLFARKHLGRSPRVVLRAALVAGHAARWARASAPRASDDDARAREWAALAVAVGLRHPRLASGGPRRRRLPS